LQQTATSAITFTSEGLTLEGVLHQPGSASGLFPAAVVCHPHPLYGGDMNNNVVAAVCQALVEAGIAALRFNFRGVGRSEGKYAGGLGERADAAAALAYLRQLPGVDEGKVGIIGYSFGANVALAAADERLAAVTAISLPSFGQALPDLTIRCPTLLVSGDRDEFSPTDSLPALAAAIGPHCQTAIISGADHFWWSYEMELAETVTQFFRRYVIG